MMMGTRHDTTTTTTRHHHLMHTYIHTHGTQKDCTSSPSFPFHGSEPSSFDGQRAIVLNGSSESESVSHQSWGSFAFGSGGGGGGGGRGGGVVGVGGGGGGALLRLCYQFHTEPYQAYPHLTATIKGVTRVVASAGDSRVAVCDVYKRLVFEGFGLGLGDQVTEPYTLHPTP
jgi:hypothetical protein